MLGCVSEKLDQEAKLKEYDNDIISFEYPDWPDAEAKQPNFLVKNNGQCVFAAAGYPVASSVLKQTLEDHFSSNFNGEYLKYQMENDGKTFNSITRIIYCEYSTYSLTIACTDENDYGSILESAVCIEKSPEPKPKLGLIATPSNDGAASIIPSVKEAREYDVDVLYWFFNWKQLENNWSLSDHLMEPMSYGGRTAVTMEVMHSNVLAQYPDRFESFTDPGFREEFAEFSVDFVKRYDPDYYFIGNEVDEYLWTHADEIDDFKGIVSYTRDRIHEEHPGTKVGFTVTYHDALRNNATYITQELADSADIIGYTSHGYHDLFVYDNVSIGKQYLQDVGSVVPGKPYAIVETGWSSSPKLDSSEKLQAEFSEYFFDYLNTTDAEFIVWFTLHDGDDCTENAESFLIELPEVKEDKEFMEAFKEYMCRLGLKKNDGSPKKAWEVWEKRTKGK